MHEYVAFRVSRAMFRMEVRVLRGRHMLNWIRGHKPSHLFELFVVRTLKLLIENTDCGQRDHRTTSTGGMDSYSSKWRSILRPPRSLFSGDHRVHLRDPVGLGLAVLGLLEQLLGVVPRRPRPVGLLLVLRVERLVGDGLGFRHDAHPLQTLRKMN